MKLFTIILLLITGLSAFSQSAQDYLDKGIEKHNAKDYKGALKDYSKAIKLDKKMHVAYFNRGTIKLATNDLKGAMKDFDKTIELDHNFIKAYYSKASVYVSQNQYKEAIPNLNKVIELNDKFPNALTLRGQLHAALNNKEASCNDFQRAKAIGDPSADKYLSKFCGNKQQGGESLLLHWPEGENWKMANSQENDQMAVIELLRNNETFENWTEIGTMQSIKGAVNVPMDETKKMMTDEVKKDCPDATITVIEKNENTEFPWIIFSIECTTHKSSGLPESQVWYIIQGKDALYLNFRAIKKGSIPEQTKTKWVNFFKTGKVVYK